MLSVLLLSTQNITTILPRHLHHFKKLVPRVQRKEQVPKHQPKQSFNSSNNCQIFPLLLLTQREHAVRHSVRVTLLQIHYGYDRTKLPQTQPEQKTSIQSDLGGIPFASEWFGGYSLCIRVIWGVFPLQLWLLIEIPPLTVLRFSSKFSSQAEGRSSLQRTYSLMLWWTQMHFLYATRLG